MEKSKVIELLNELVNEIENLRVETDDGYDINSMIDINHTIARCKSIIEDKISNLKEIHNE